jgi:hypothetical protein
MADVSYHTQHFSIEMGSGEEKFVCY